MNEISDKIQFHILIMYLFESLEDKKIVNRERINKQAKDVIQLLELLKGTNVKFESWKDYKRLCRDLPGYVYERNINELENLKEFILESKPVNTESKKLTYRQVALIYQYEKWPLTESIATEAIKNDYTFLKSSKKLATEYRKFNTPNQRCGNGFQTTNDIRIVLPYLSKDAKLLAENELQQAIVNQSKKGAE